MPVYSRTQDRFDVWFSDSPDLQYWGNSHLATAVEHFPYANEKVGPAAPPIRPAKGWLTTVHCVDIDFTRGKRGWEDRWQKRYTAGLLMLDLNEPWMVVGRYDQPLLYPETDAERFGFRDDVIFPSGMIREPDGEVKIYCGAADPVECLATGHVDDLLALCKPM